jgi:hypothetical protein
MSGATFESYHDKYAKSAMCYSGDAAASSRAFTERSVRLGTFKSELGTKSAMPREKRKEADLYDSDLVTHKITKPDPKTQTLHIVMIDNSGSNAIIAKHMRESSGYFMATLNQIDPESQVAFMYSSDHCDGKNFIQEIDYLFPEKKGDRALFSSCREINPANGGDAAEAFECSLKQASELDFGNAKNIHLYLVTDVVAHGMGMESDDGCPNQVSWKASLKKVHEKFTSFEVIGCGDDPAVGKLQQQFIKTDRLAFDLIDLSSIPEARHRAGITGNALLFLIARHRGLQAVEMFLTFLYEKWLEDPVFGTGSDSRAKEMISRFSKFLEEPQKKVASIMDKIFA